MKRVSSIIAAVSLIFILAAPAAAIDFPEQGNLQSCEVVTSLPKDVIGHLFEVSPATAQKLLDLVTDACNF